QATAERGTFAVAGVSGLDSRGSWRAALAILAAAARFVAAAHSMVGRASSMVVFGLRNAQLCVGLLAVLLLLPFHGLATAQAERDTGPLRAIDSALRERNFEQALELIRVQLQQAPGD